MSHWLINAALRNRFLVVAGFLLVAGWGYWALRTVPIDAIPDLSDNQVIVFTDWPGRSPQEGEDQITYPLTVSLQGLPSVRVVRSSSAFGFSMINVIFEDAVDIYFARTRVLERLNLVGKSLPPGIVPTLGPDATGVGHVFWYTVEGKDYALQDLRSLQAWFIRYQLNAVPGVAEVASVGGVVRQYQIDVDPNRLRAFRIRFSAVVDAVMRSNRNVGGNVIEANSTWTFIRGLGLIERLSDIEQIVIGAENGIPIFVCQVAAVQVGDAFRASALVKGTAEAVGGVVVARYGVSTIDVINRIKEKITALEERARVVAEVLRRIPGAVDVYPEQVTGAPYLDVRVNREAAARYGITVGAIQDVIETAVGETNLVLTIEGRQRFPVRVRYAPQYRASPEALASVPVPAPNGMQLPLGQLAEIKQVSGPSMISSENGLLVVTVLLNVRGRDVGSFVEEAKTIVAQTVKLPQGSYIEWSGQYENEVRARQRLQIVIPVVLAVIYLLLYLTYHSLLEAAHVLLAVPFALSGGIYLLYALGYNMSVAVMVGFIALFGTAVQTAVVMVIYLEEAVARKRQALGGQLTRAALLEAVTEGALLRLRPKVMTVSTVVASLLPIMWSHSTGSEVMKPLATPVLGGMVSSLLHVLLVTPVIFYWLRERELRREERRDAVEIDRALHEQPTLGSADGHSVPPT